jgi:hypothetical protein
LSRKEGRKEAYQGRKEGIPVQNIQPVEGYFNTQYSASREIPYKIFSQ